MLGAYGVRMLVHYRTNILHINIYRLLFGMYNSHKCIRDSLMYIRLGAYLLLHCFDMCHHTWAWNYRVVVLHSILFYRDIHHHDGLALFGNYMRCITNANCHSFIPMLDAVPHLPIFSLSMLDIEHNGIIPE